MAEVAFAVLVAVHRAAAGEPPGRGDLEGAPSEADVEAVGNLGDASVARYGCQMRNGAAPFGGVTAHGSAHAGHLDSGAQPGSQPPCQHHGHHGGQTAGPAGRVRRLAAEVVVTVLTLGPGGDTGALRVRLRTAARLELLDGLAGHADGPADLHRADLLGADQLIGLIDAAAQLASDLPDLQHATVV